MLLHPTLKDVPYTVAVLRTYVGRRRRTALVARTYSYVEVSYLVVYRTRVSLQPRGRPRTTTKVGTRVLGRSR
jgi:hypothetical protein